MGNFRSKEKVCLHGGNPHIYMGFRVIPVQSRCEILKSFLKCKKRKKTDQPEATFFESLNQESEIIQLLFDYEEPISITLNDP